MKNNKKGFTLIELIVVMAILSILMAGVFALFKPVSAFHLNASETDKRYTAVQGICDYIEESVKFAKTAYIFTDIKSLNGITIKDGDGTFQPIHERILKSVGLDPTKDDNLKKVQIISIYNQNDDGFKADEWSNGKKYTGRVYKTNGITNKSNYFENEYEVCGKGYYGKYNYIFNTTINKGTTEEKTSSESYLFVNATMAEEDITQPLSADASVSAQFLNHDKTGAGQFIYVDADEIPKPDNVKGITAWHPNGNPDRPGNIFIVYVNP